MAQHGTDLEEDVVSTEMEPSEQGTEEQQDTDDELPPFLANGIYARGDLRRMCCAYGDAFLSRCGEIGDTDSVVHEMPLRTSICPWMPKYSEEEEFYEAGCRVTASFITVESIAEIVE